MYLSCQDWWSWLQNGKSLVPPLALDKNLTNEAVASFNLLCLPAVVYKPLIQQAAGEWLAIL